MLSSQHSCNNGAQNADQQQATTRLRRGPRCDPSSPLIPPSVCLSQDALSTSVFGDGSFMAQHQRKRQQADDQPRSDTAPPAKKTKTRSELERDAWASWTYPPAFWDGLSEICLTRKAVEEQNRRIRCQHRQLRPSAFRPELNDGAQRLVRTLPARDLARFARHGGPDLSDLRGFSPLTSQRPPSLAMSASQSSRSRRTKSTDPTTTPPTSTKKSKKSTPYNRDFDLHLTDHGVRPVYSSQRPDLTEVREALAVRRPSLSPSKFSDGAFETFQESNDRAKDEDDVLANVIPTLLGPQQPAHASARNTVFGNLEPLTDGTIAPAKPDIYYGAHPEELSRAVRDELGHHIMPSTMQDKPLAPNFFLELKGPDGSLAVATRQARYDGASGSRAMHSLQNYGEEELQYDGQPYTFSSIYHGGQLQMYAHHPTAPTDEGGRPEYHMTKIRGFEMTDTRDTFIQGATAFRNARDLAKQHRDRFIQAANTRASRSGPSASQDIVEIQEEEEQATDGVEWRDGDDELQQYIADASGHGSADDGGAIPVPPSFDAEGDSAEPSQDSVAALRDEPSTSFVSSFTSSVNTTKRSRPSVSPPSPARGSRSSNSRKRPGKRRTAEPPPADAAQYGAGESWEDAPSAEEFRP